MKKLISRKSFLLPVSLITLTAVIILACVDIEIENYPASFFAPETVHSAMYYPFFRSYYPLYEGGYKESYVSDFDNTNVNEWYAYFGGSVLKTDLHNILYTMPTEQIDTLIFTLKKPGYPISEALKSNSVLKVKDKRMALDFLYYMGFAKRCEPYGTYQPDWYALHYDHVHDMRKDTAEMNKLIAGGLKQVGNTNSDFVKQRYVFQAMRLYFISGHYNNCLQLYNADKNLFNSPANTMKYRAMGYAAGAYYNKKDYATANYLYSLVYDNCDSMKVAAYFSFKPQEESDWNQTLAMAKTPRQKAVLWQMLGIYRDPLRAMKEIYAINPKSDLLDLLLVRSVNIAEENFYPQNPIEGPLVNDINDTGLHSDLVDFIKTTADKETTDKPYEWNLAAGYLCWAKGEAGFDRYLAQADKEAAHDSLVHEQVRLIRLMNNIQHGKAGDKNFENSVAGELMWLKNDKHPTYFRRNDAFAWVLHTLDEKYAAIHDDAKATCFNGIETNDTLAQNNALLNNIVALMDKPGKTEFEKFTLSVFPYKRNDLIQMQAVNLLYHYKFKEADAKLNEAKDLKGDSLAADPFLIHINDNHDSDAALPNKMHYTRRSFIKKIIALQALAAAESDPGHKADYYFQLANAFYNMSYFGNNRILYQTAATYIPEVDWYFIKEEEKDYAEKPKDSFYREYIAPLVNNTQSYMSDAMALQYYTKAMQLAANPEMKAQCCFMAAKCEQNNFICNKPDNYKGDFKAGAYFKMLKDNYSNTQYYKEVINECGYFKTYLAENR